MPIDARERPRMLATVVPCRAVVAARVNGPVGAERALPRHLRVRVMAGELIDEPEVIAGAARDAGLDPALLEDWMEQPRVEEALRGDAAARDPSAPARALDHKPADADGSAYGRRYTCPSFEILRSDTATASSTFPASAVSPHRAS